MFSNEDIREVFQLIPPEKIRGGFPSLVLSASGDGLLTLHQIQADFESLVSTRASRLSASALAHELDIDVDLGLQLARGTSRLALLSEDKRDIITKEQRDLIEKHLRSLAATQLVSKSAFSQEHNVSIESIDALIHPQDDDTRIDDDFVEADDYILGKAYQQALLEKISIELKRCFEDAETVELSTEMLPGFPPVWYISRIVQDTLRDSSKSSQVHLQETPELIRCVPTEFLESKRDAQITELTNGSLAYLDLHSLWKNFRELHPSLKDVQAYFSTVAEVDISGTIATSNVWPSRHGDECIQELHKHEYVDFTSKIEEQLPSTVRIQTQEKVFNYIATTHAQTSPTKLHRADPYLLTATKYNSTLANTILPLAKSLAATQRTTNLEAPDNPKDLKFTMSSLIQSIPSTDHLIHVLAKEKSVEKAAEEHFWTSIATLETENEAAFSTFWEERITLRFQTNVASLNNIPDAKLKEQLSDLLATYFRTEQILDVIGKARTQGLMGSRRTRKNVQRLESVLGAYVPAGNKDKAKDVNLDLASLSNALDKFAKKQGIPAPSSDALHAHRESLLSDLRRRLQKATQQHKQSDDPSLFLTLVVLLLAQQNTQGEDGDTGETGVVYATGKFAPKLLKLLKRHVTEDEYEALETWKEKAKAGKLGKDERMEMWKMIGNEESGGADAVGESTVRDGNGGGGNDERVGGDEA